VHRINLSNFRVNHSSVFVRQQGTECDFSKKDSWIILSPIEQSIKQKIEAIGTPLKDWDINIYRGILTGYNEAFIIDGKTKDKLIAEDAKSAEIIRPILRGRDIKRYGYEFADLYLITTFPSLKIDIEQFPAVKNHLLSYGIERLEQTGKEYKVNGETIKARKKTTNKWFETQDSISYWEDFYKQKIVWKAVGRNLAFSLLEEGSFITAPASFITSNQNLYLLGFLCSSFAKYYILNNSDTTGAGDIMLNIQSLSNIPVPKPDKNEQITKLVQQIINDKTNGENINELEIKINKIVNDLFGFAEEEIAFIDAQ
jgi:hypothetical protein